ncbi:hypothetical protein H9P43_005630 [Blastocladiella emersonii ATCC 22665]|nr:hypothetical protein H9P43_005630 [Blastocladiella emersonii ATCC 22665]
MDHPQQEAQPQAPPLPPVIEFYSGIGGLAYGWSRSRRGPSLGRATTAFDINEHANAVHSHNRPECQIVGDILALTPADLDALAGRYWLLSPPCQPYSRRGNRLGADDPRAQSFLGMIDALPVMQNPPEGLLIENVLGFERDETYARLCKTLDDCGYYHQSFIFNANALMIPNSRPRFFLIARKSRAFPSPSGTLHTDLSWLLAQYRPDLPTSPRPIADYLRPSAAATRAAHLAIPNAQLWKAAAQYDVVWPADTRSCCFTKAYGRHARGSGSVLCGSGDATRATLDLALAATAAQLPAVAAAVDARVRDRLAKRMPPPVYARVVAGKPLAGKYARMVDEERANAWADSEVVPRCPLADLELRHFAPEEMAALHGFPDDLEFPADKVTTKQGWQLVGNSLNVEVVAVLLDYLLDDEDE